MSNDEKQVQALAQAILAKAGWKLGGASLAEHLGVSDATLADWLSGKSVAPPEALEKAVRLLEPGLAVNGLSDAGTLQQVDK